MNSPAGTSDDHPSVKATEISIEQRHVDLAHARLAEMREEARQLLRDGYRLAEVGTAGALVERDVAVYRAALRARSLETAHEGLVFGRLDLRERERRYVGRLGIRTRDYDSLVIDWRAPAAAAFYRATPEDPLGVVRRRVLHCRRERVVDIEDDLIDPDGAPQDMVVVGDGAFLATLARARGGRMRDIVATIQREQDEVIRAPVDGTVVVRGGPGTGKTAVALHRVAWLLFRHRRRFGSRGVLVVGPGPRFTAYIERVLPSLGEGEGATLRSLGDLVEGITAAHHDDPATARVKGSGRMVAVLRRAASDAPPGAPAELRVVHQGTVIRLAAAQLRRVRHEVHRGGRRKPNTARSEAAGALLSAAWRRLGEFGHDPLALPPDRDEFDENVRDQLADFLAAWWPRRSPVRELLWLADPGRLARAAGNDLSSAEVALLAGCWERSARTGRLSYADIALIDELDAILGRPARRRTPVADAEDPYVVDGIDMRTGEDVWGQRDTLREVTTFTDRAAARPESSEDGSAEYGHIVVDEAQDLSPMQWRMLARRGRHATWTIVEDAAQSAWEDLASSRAAMETALGRRDRHEFELTTNYRNPVEIASVAALVLHAAMPGARAPRAVRSTGYPPLLQPMPRPGPAVRSVTEDLLGHVEGTIGVITAMHHRDEAARWLDGLPERVQVLGGLDAKGLEFDAVVLVEPGEIVASSATGLRTLYVALTRATQRLVVIGRKDTWPDALPYS